MKTNPVIENILSRRSIRSFTDEPVAREDLEAVVTCGQWAPSGMNRQAWTFGVPATAEVHGVCALGHAAAPGVAHERTSRVVWA